MDDYDPFDAFMKSNEEQKKKDDEYWQREMAGFRLSQKRGENEISDSVVIDPQRQLLNGLQKPIAKETFGMRMLEKMGYKEGQGLGKDGNGIKEPIQVKLKYDKYGIGHEELEKKQREETEYEHNIKALRQELYYNMKVQQFKSQLKVKVNNQNIIKDIRQAQQAIEILDEKHGIMNNKLLLKEDEDCDIEGLSMHLGRMIEYLRSTYFYCIYCGCAYDNEADLNNNCPGWGRDAH